MCVGVHLYVSVSVHVCTCASVCERVCAYVWVHVPVEGNKRTPDTPWRWSYGQLGPLDMGALRAAYHWPPWTRVLILELSLFIVLFLKSPAHSLPHIGV